MGTIIALTGSDTIIIGSLGTAPMTGLADGNCVELEFPNDIANVKTGKDGNSIYGLNTTGIQCNVKIRLIRGCADDIRLNSLLSGQNANFAGFTLLTGSFIKKLGTGLGAIGSDTYTLSGGVFTKQVEAKTNVEGETEQSVSMYAMRFASVKRVIGLPQDIVL